MGQLRLTGFRAAREALLLQTGFEVGLQQFAFAAAMHAAMAGWKQCKTGAVIFGSADQSKRNLGRHAREQSHTVPVQLYLEVQL